MAPARVVIQTADFDLAEEVAALRAGDGGVGARLGVAASAVDKNGEGQGCQCRG